MKLSKNNNIFQYNNHKNITKFKKQLGGVAKKISNPDNDDILLMKIYLKIYIRLFLYIQYKLNKKLMTGDGINNPNRAIKQRTLLDAMNLYREDVEMQTYLQSTDLFFIRPLFESMCKDNYNDICIQYFNSFILPKKEFDPEGVKQLMEKIIGKYFNLMKEYETLAGKKAYQDILDYVRSLDGQLSQDDFVNLMDMIKREIQKFKGTTETTDTKARERELAGEPRQYINEQLQQDIKHLQNRIEKLESFKDKTDEDIKKLEDSSKKDEILKELTGKLTTLNSQSSDNLRKEIEKLRSDTDNQIGELKSLVQKLQEELKVIRTEFHKKIEELKDSSKTEGEKDTELTKLRTEYEARIKQLEKEKLELTTKIDEKKSEPIDPSALNSFTQKINLFNKEQVSPSEEPLKAEIIAGLRQLLEEIKTTNKSIAELLGKKLEVSVEGMDEVIEFIKEFHSKLDAEREARITAERENTQELAKLTDSKRDDLHLNKLAMESMKEANTNVLKAIEHSSQTVENIAKAALDSKTAQLVSAEAKAELDALKEKSRSNEAELQRLRDQLSQANTEKERDKRELIQAQLEEAKRREDKLLDRISTQQTVVTDTSKRETDTSETTRRLLEEQRRLTDNMERSNAKLVQATQEQVKREREHTKDLEEARRIAVSESQKQLSDQLAEEKRRYESEKSDKDRLQAELTAELRKAAELAKLQSQKVIEIQSTPIQPDSEKLLAKLEKDKEELKSEIENTRETIISKLEEIDGKVTDLTRLQENQTDMIKKITTPAPPPPPPMPPTPPAPPTPPPAPPPPPPPPPAPPTPSPEANPESEPVSEPLVPQNVEPGPKPEAEPEPESEPEPEPAEEKILVVTGNWLNEQEGGKYETDNDENSLYIINNLSEKLSLKDFIIKAQTDLSDEFKDAIKPADFLEYDDEGEGVTEDIYKVNIKTAELKNKHYFLKDNPKKILSYHNIKEFIDNFGENPKIEIVFVNDAYKILGEEEERATNSDEYTTNSTPPQIIFKKSDKDNGTNLSTMNLVETVDSQPTQITPAPPAAAPVVSTSTPTEKNILVVTGNWLNEQEGGKYETDNDENSLYIINNLSEKLSLKDFIIKAQTDLSDEFKDAIKPADFLEYDDEGEGVTEDIYKVNIKTAELKNKHYFLKDNPKKILSYHNIKEFIDNFGENPKIEIVFVNDAYKILGEEEERATNSDEYTTNTTPPQIIFKN